MYSNLSLYYLNQLGIRPWITKEVYDNEQHQPESNDPSPAVMVFYPSSISAKAALLLKKMIAVLAIEQDQLLNVRIDDLDLLNRQKSAWYSVLQKQGVKAILFYGMNPEEITKDLTISCPEPVCLDPELLMSQALAKRNAFEALVKIKQLLD